MPLRSPGFQGQLISLIILWVSMFWGCNRHPAPLPIAAREVPQKEVANPPKLAVPIGKAVTESTPLAFDSVTVAKLITLTPSVQRYGQADECRVYQVGPSDKIYIHQEYVVRYTELSDDMANKVSVYSNNEKSDSIVLRGLAHMKPMLSFDGYAEYFYGMRDSLLFTDVGTADIRSVEVYNVVNRRKVYEGTFAESFWLSSPDTLAFYEILEERPDSKTYPEVKAIRAHGNTPVLLELVKVSLSTFIKSRTGQRKLSALD